MKLRALPLALLLVACSSDDGAGDDEAGTTSTATDTDMDTDSESSSGSESESSSGSESESSGESDTAPDTSDEATADTETGTETGPPEQIPCGDKIYACGDGIDNDNDGLVDLDDLDCLSPCEDTEEAFDPWLPGQDWICKRDCFYDPDIGSGNDQCEMQLVCDPLDPGADFGCAHEPDYPTCGQSLALACIDYCEPLTANGCDCFGCCEIEGVFRFVGHGTQCGADDPSACPACTPNAECQNPCDSEGCELCFLQTIDDLAPGCEAPSCPVGVEPCADSSACAEGEFCQTGCCRPTIPG